MDETTPERVHAHEVVEVGEIAVTPSGERILVNIKLANGMSEWLSFDYAQLGRMAVSMVSTSHHAAALRTQTTPMGNAMPERVARILPHAWEVQAKPEGVELRAVLTPKGATTADFLLSPPDARAIGQALLEAADRVPKTPPGIH